MLARSDFDELISRGISRRLGIKDGPSELEIVEQLQNVGIRMTGRIVIKGTEDL